MPIQFKKGTTSQWGIANPLLANGQPGVERTLDGNNYLKIGDGTSVWSSTPYLSAMSNAPQLDIIDGNFQVATAWNYDNGTEPDSTGLLRIKARYIRDYLNGSTANSGNHWVEIQAFDGTGTNVALNKTVTASTTFSVSGAATSLQSIVDGDINTNNWVAVGSSGSQYVQIDLGAVYYLPSIVVFHYYADARSYYYTKTQVSIDGINWYSIFDAIPLGTYIETSSGHSMNAYVFDRRTQPSYYYPIWDVWRCNGADNAMMLHKGSHLTDVPGSYNYCAMVWDKAMSTARSSYYINQAIEDGFKNYISHPYTTISFYARCDSGNKGMRVHFNTDYNYQDQTIYLNTTWTRYYVTFYNDPALFKANMYIPTTGTISISFATDGTLSPQSYGTIYITQVQLDRGNVPQPFRYRSFDQEVLRTLRYYEQSCDYGIPPGALWALSSGNVGNAYSIMAVQGGNVIGSQRVPFRVEKRASPTVSWYDFISNIGKNGTIHAAQFNVTGYTLTNVSTYSTPLSFTFMIVNGGGTSVNQLEAVWVADARY